MHKRCTIHADIAEWSMKFLDCDVFPETLNFDALCRVLFIVPYLQDKYH